MNPDLLIYALAALLIIGVWMLVTGGGVGDKVEPAWPYVKVKQVMSSPEQVLYFRLVEALPDSLILAQVQLIRLVNTPKGRDFQMWFNKISRMSVDFVVCDKQSGIVAVIELDDKSHSRKDRQEADAKKSKVLRDAGIPLIRWQVGNMPDVNGIQVAVAARGNAASTIQGIRG